MNDPCSRNNEVNFPGLTGLFCPCVLFGPNVETLKEEISQNGACICHVILCDMESIQIQHYSLLRVCYLHGGAVVYIPAWLGNPCRGNII